MIHDRFAMIGESLVDVIVDGSGGLTTRAGGSPMNVAIGAARLGLNTALITAYGHDDHGALVQQHIESEGVTLINRGDPRRPTNQAVATLAADGSAEYAFHMENQVRGAADAIVGSDLAHLHVGSITAVSDGEWADVLAAVESSRDTATISYDPNCRPDLGIPIAEGRRRAEKFVGVADLVKASDEDLTWLYPEQTADAVAARWMDAGARLVVITHGEEGPIGYAEGVRVSVPASRTHVTDTVGAGDSFMAAMLAWCDERGMLGRSRLPRFSADEVRGMLEFAARASAITCARVGANPPTRAELERN